MSVYSIVLIDGKPFLCEDCGSIMMKLIDAEEQYYECQGCGTVYKKS